MIDMNEAVRVALRQDTERYRRAMSVHDGAKQEMYSAVEAAAEYLSEHEIARITGLSRRTVRRILGKRDRAS